MSKPASAPPTRSWPTGSSEMASRIRELNWAETTLGPIPAWPASLRHAIDLMLSADVQIVVFWGPEYIAFYNDTYAPTIGNKHPTALGRPASESWTELWDDLEPLLAKVLATGETVSAKDRPFYIERHGYGETVYFDISYSPVHTDDGAVGGVLCIVNETTPRIRAEAARRQAETDVARLAAIVQSSDDAIISKDLDGVITSWNQGAQRLFGYTAAEAIGRAITMLIPQERLDEEETILAKIRRGERTQHFETKRRRKDGSLVDVSLTISPVKDAKGRIIGASKIGRDITERRQAQETQLLLISELNHRVKNTLATVQAIAQQTLRRTQNTEEFVKSFSGRIQSLSRVHTLLSASTWRSADLSELVRDQLMYGAIDETRVAVSGPRLKLAPQRALHLAMILHELATNAVKYGALSRASGSIDIDWSVEDHVLALQWREHGGPPVTVTGKRGFGTTLIEQSAKGEGGSATMRVEAEGVHWILKLPLSELLAAEPPADAAANDPRLDRRPRPATANRGRLAGKRMLIVEDEPPVALELADVLQSADAEVVASVASVADAVTAIGLKPDAAILDGNLHGHPVDEIAAALTHAKVPFVFVSGYGRESLPRGYRDAPLVNKPFNASELLDAATRLFDPGVIRPGAVP